MPSTRKKKQQAAAVAARGRRARRQRKPPLGSIKDKLLITAAPVPSDLASARFRRVSSVAKVGPLLSAAMKGLQRDFAQATGLARAVLDLGVMEDGGGTDDTVLPIFLQTPPMPAQTGEKWKDYKQRVADHLGPISEKLQSNAGLKCEPIHSGNVLQTSGLSGQIEEALKHEGIGFAELDAPVEATLLDDAMLDLEIPSLRTRHPGLDGSGVRVAILDSGIDVLHPWLQVAESVSTCDEDVNIPGLHATHVAGCLASRDEIYGGVAPGVTLINIKVLSSIGRGAPTSVGKGIDAALDRAVHIISLSVGWNHLPTWSNRGHGWRCVDGKCQLCMAVNNAVVTENVVAVVAAGNEHERANFLRASNLGKTFDTELACPGQAANAFTVGAITKRTFLTAPFSSRGPTAFGLNKPDIAAPGVNVTSCVPARRDSQGNVVPALVRGDLCAQKGGTSIAAPMVAGVAALMLQKRMQSGASITPNDVRAEILSTMFKQLAASASEVGVGRVCVTGL